MTGPVGMMVTSRPSSASSDRAHETTLLNPESCEDL